MLSIVAGSALVTMECLADVSESISEDIDLYVQGWVRHEGFGGVVTVTRGDSQLHDGSYGEDTRGQDSTISGLFHVPAITKLVTAICILQLSESNRLDIADSVNKYLPPTHRSPEFSGITIHQLLSHSSSVRDYGDDDESLRLTDSSFPLVDKEEVIAKIKALGAEIQPNKTAAYNNFGYLLLGEAVAYVSGVPYADYVRKNVFYPIGLRSSFILNGEEVSHDLLPEVVNLSGSSGSQLHRLVSPADGGLVISTQEVVALVSSLFGAERALLSDESVDLLSREHARIGRGGPVDSFGYGLYAGERLLAIFGYNSQVVIDRVSEVVIVVFSVDGREDLADLGFGLFGLVLRLTR